MSEISIPTGASPEEVIPQLQALMDESEPPLTVMANTASLLYWSLEAINWVGFYLHDGSTLRLGPFHGKPACTVIAVGKGVCGTAFAERKRINVPDVHDFPGHIACDSASKSELVLPLIHDGIIYGVLDVDSPVHNRFGIAEERLFEATAELVSNHLAKWKGHVFPA